MTDPEMMAYYQHGLERDRLASGARRIEFLRIWDVLQRHLPSPPARVLDVGGGAGAFAIPLAAAGYEVHLVDVPLHVEQPSAAPSRRLTRSRWADLAITLGLCLAQNRLAAGLARPAGDGLPSATRGH